MASQVDKEVVCTKCGKKLIIPTERASKKGKCPYCDEVFVLPVTKIISSSWNNQAERVVGETAPVDKGTPIRGVSSWITLKGAVIIALSILVVGMAYCVFNYMGTRYHLNVVGKTTYRIDRQTGKTSIIHPNGVIVNAREPVVIKNRELDVLEVFAIEGWAGLRYKDEGFGGSFYNGNDDIVVSELTVCLTYTNEVRKITRLYKTVSAIKPLQTTEFYFNIVNPGRDLAFEGWTIKSAKGHKLSDESDDD